MRTENSHSNRNKLTVVPNQAIMAVGSPSPYVIISRNSRVTGIHSTTPTKRRWRRGRLLRMYGRHVGMLLLGRNLFEYVFIANISRFDVLVLCRPAYKTRFCPRCNRTTTFDPQPLPKSALHVAQKSLPVPQILVAVDCQDLHEWSCLTTCQNSI